MTDHDYRLEDQRDHKPNYTLRRVKTALASIAFVVSCTLLFVAERPASAPGLWIVAGIYLLTGLWLIVRFAPRDDDTYSSPRPVGRHGESRDN